MAKIPIALATCVMLFCTGFMFGRYGSGDDWISPAAAETIHSIRETNGDLRRENARVLRNDGIIIDGLGALAQELSDFRDAASGDTLRFAIVDQSSANRIKAATDLIRETDYHLIAAERIIKSLGVAIP